MSKPREFAHLLRNRFGSADNINHIRTAEHVSGAAIVDEGFTATPSVAIGLGAGNSNSLPGHGSQVLYMSRIRCFRCC